MNKECCEKCEAGLHLGNPCECPCGHQIPQGEKCDDCAWLKKNVKPQEGIYEKCARGHTYPTPTSIPQGLFRSGTGIKETLTEPLTPTSKETYPCHGEGGAGGNCPHFPAPTSKGEEWQTGFKKWLNEPYPASWKSHIIVAKVESLLVSKDTALREALHQQIRELTIRADSENTETTASLIRHIWETILRPKVLALLNEK